jgi:hypothetical protein
MRSKAKAMFSLAPAARNASPMAAERGLSPNLAFI